MPGGIFDSSKTRVAPVFDALAGGGKHWVPQLLQLAEHSPNRAAIDGLNLEYLNGGWGANETPLAPPVGLLSWMIRNPSMLRPQKSDHPERLRLLDGDPQVTALALDSLRASASHRAWYIFEGPTVPDAYIETPDALIVVEGKRTEARPTTDTTWLSGRHQIWRHLDAAWERRARRQVFGLFIVEGTPGTGEVPAVWRAAVEDALTPSALASSFPHRGPEERAAIAAALAGVTTWQRVLESFRLPSSTLVDRLPSAL